MQQRQCLPACNSSARAAYILNFDLEKPQSSLDEPEGERAGILAVAGWSKNADQLSSLRSVLASWS